MVDLDFSVTDAHFDATSLAPLMLFKLNVANNTPEIAIRNVVLHSQVRIEPVRRRYEGREPEQLFELFGEQERWGSTLQSFLWAHAHISIPAFEQKTQAELPVACSYDFNLAATKYFYGLEGGEAPLSFLFSGEIFYRSQDGRLQITQIPWNKTASWRMPVATWRAMIDRHYRNCAWLQLRRDVFDRLYSFRRENGLSGWEETIMALLGERPGEVLQ